MRFGRKMRIFIVDKKHALCYSKRSSPKQINVNFKQGTRGFTKFKHAVAILKGWLFRFLAGTEISKRKQIRPGGQSFSSHGPRPTVRLVRPTHATPFHAAEARTMEVRNPITIAHLVLLLPSSPSAVHPHFPVGHSRFQRWSNIGIFNFLQL